MADVASLARLVELGKECGQMARRLRAEQNRQLKPDGSLVTAADRAIESFLRIELPRLVPGSTVWGEEEGFESPGQAGLWLVDPVDGTSNYSFGSPLWGVSIAHYQNGAITMGCIALPDFDEIYSAGAGTGAYLNGERLTPIPAGPIEPFHLLSYDDGFLRDYQHHPIPGKMRYAGAYVVEAAFVFRQSFRGLISYKANLYDVAASLVIAGELGAEIRYLDGTRLDLPPIIEARCITKPFLIGPAGSGFTLPFVDRSAKLIKR